MTHAVRGRRKNPPSSIERVELVRDRHQKLTPVLRHAALPWNPALAASSLCETDRSRSSAGSARLREHHPENPALG